MNNDLSIPPKELFSGESSNTGITEDTQNLNIPRYYKYGREWNDGWNANRIPEPVTNPVDMIQNAPRLIFSSMYGYMQWFFSLRWYVILLSLVVFFFMRFYLEYTIKNRRTRRDAKKENMQPNDKKVEKMRGIMRDSEIDNVPLPKDDPSPNITRLQDEHSFYQVWIVPSIYVLFRKLGIY
jgi:hypothetical protein